MNRSGLFPYIDLQGTDAALAKQSHASAAARASRSRTPSKRDILDRAAIDRLERQVRRTRPDSPTSPGANRRSRTPEVPYEARAMQQRTRSVSRDGRLKPSLRNSITTSNAVVKRPPSRPRQRSRPREGHGHEAPQQRENRHRRERRQEPTEVRRPWQDKPRGRPWDDSGYCPIHPEVKLARKKRSGGWNVKLHKCPKCVKRQEQNGREDTASITDDSADEGHMGRQRSNSFPSRHSKARSRSGGRQTPARRKGSGGGRSQRPHRHTNGSDRSRSPPRSIRSKSPLPMRRSFSLSSRSRGKHSTKSSKGRKSSRVPACVNGAPFDKHGRCTNHPQVKLASKKLLGGWKIYMEYCPLCERDGEGSSYGSDGGGDYGSGSEYGESVASGMSQLSLDSSFYSRKSTRSGRSMRSMRSANASVASHRSRGSVRSFASRGSRGSVRSNRSSSSWSSGGSSRRRVKRKDKSFLPLDEEGYCLRHPDVRLAKMSRRGGLKIILDFCPECAEESLAQGGSPAAGGKKSIRRVSTSTASLCSSHRSARSGRSDGSSSTFIERMPYVDGEGQPGHYTGHVDEEGQPNGEGKLKYINGSKFEGVWHEGTKLHGTMSKKVRTKARKGKDTSRRDAPSTATMSPGPPPMPPPPLYTKKQHSDKDGKKLGEQKGSGHRRVPRDAPRDAPGGGGHREEGSYSDGSSSGKRSSLHRLRRKCDEIDKLLKECPASAKERKDSMDSID